MRNKNKGLDLGKFIRKSIRKNIRENNRNFKSVRNKNYRTRNVKSEKKEQTRRLV